MCCHADVKSTKVVLNKLNKNQGKWIWGYKVLYKDDTGLNSSIYSYIWKPRWNLSNCKRKTTVKRDTQLTTGIHIYLNKNDAENEIFDECDRLVAVKCYLDDFIGAESDFDSNDKFIPMTAVFKKVYLPENQYKKAMKDN